RARRRILIGRCVLRGGGVIRGGERGIQWCCAGLFITGRNGFLFGNGGVFRGGGVLLQRAGGGQQRGGGILLGGAGVVGDGRCVLRAQQQQRCTVFIVTRVFVVRSG